MKLAPKLPKDCGLDEAFNLFNIRWFSSTFGDFAHRRRSERRL